MGARHQARMWAVQILFQRDLNRGDVEEAIGSFWRLAAGEESESAPAIEPRAKQFAEELVRGVCAHEAELDAKLRAYAEHWDLHRMGAVDRNVMRVALYEMLHCPDIPPVVSINEAVEIAKELSSLESGRFVNGILDRALRDLDRPARGTGSRAKPVPSSDG